MSKEVSFEDLNSLVVRINDLSLKVGEISAQLKYISENSHKISEHTDTIGELSTSVAVMEKEVEFLKTNYTTCRETTCQQLKAELKSIADLTEKYNELQGQINQIRLAVENHDNEMKEKRSNIKNIIFPVVSNLIYALIIFFIGYMAKKMIMDAVQNIHQTPSQIQRVDKS